MAFETRKLPVEIAFAVVEANNQRMLDSVASFFHKDTTSVTSRADFTAPTRSDLQVTAANASSEATSVALANDLKRVINLHFADAVAHDSALSAAVATASATALASAITLANALKAAFNTHLSASDVHFNNDSTNTVAATNASDQSSLNTLLNEMKGDVNAHIVSAPAGAWIQLTDA
jgi:hypothetical protein